jgi:hypothetical protein
MYAQVVGRTVPEKHEQIENILRDVVFPALGEEPGFSGALSLVDRNSGSMLTVLLWETAEQAFRPPSAYGDRFQQALADISRVTADPLPPVSVWEVDAHTHSRL